MIIAQISDTHIALDTADAEQRLTDFTRTIADINRLDPAPDLIVHSGDIVHNGRPEEYAAAAAILAEARAPVYVMAGNKDNRRHLRQAFADGGYLTADSDFIDYAVEGHPVRVVALDTKSDTGNKGDFCAARIERLDAMVDADAGRPVVVFTHHPPFTVTVGPDPINFETEAIMTGLADALRRSGQVIAVFSGHVHRSTTGAVGDIPAAVMTSVATPLRKGTLPDGMKGRPTYAVHRYDPAWGFVTETRIVDG